MATKPKPPTYVYNAQVLSVYDGDTFTALLDLGMSVSMKTSCRLVGLDTPEMKGKSELEKALAKKAQARHAELILGKTVVLHSVATPDKYGRLLVDAWIGDVHVNQILIDEKLARPYDGGTKSDWSIQ